MIKDLVNQIQTMNNKFDRMTDTMTNLVQDVN